MILNQMDGYVLPGVGAFPDAMNRLLSLGLDRYIKQIAKTQQTITRNLFRYAIVV